MQSQLIWSRLEILKLFRRFVREEKPVAIEFDDDEEKLVLTRALQVNAHAGRVVFAFGDHKRTNAALLRSDRLLFTTEEGVMSYRFTSERARDAMFRGQPTFHVKLPEALIYVDRRREQRLQIPKFSAPAVSLDLPDGRRWKGQLGDLSEGGVGVIGLDSKVPIQKGMKLRCAVELLSRKSMVLEVEVRYIRRAEEAAGVRVGFRIVQGKPDFARLLELFRVEV